MTVTILTNNQSYNLAQQSTASVRDDGGPFTSQQYWLYWSKEALYLGTYVCIRAFSYVCESLFSGWRLLLVLGVVVAV